MALTDLTGGQDPFSKAPAGLQQAKAQNPMRDLTGGVADPWIRPGWQTGGQTGTTQNSFNDDFYKRMYDQYDEEQAKIRKDPGYVSNLFLRNDFTGIVGWDQTFKKDNPVFTVDRDRVFKTGDVYDNGKFLGNVYDDPKLSTEEANSMVAPHVFGNRAADKYKEANGDQEKLKSFILDQGKSEGQKVSAYVSRVPYQREVDKTLKEWQDSPWDEIGATAAGAAGGVAAGVVGGVPGMVVGGLVGAVGGLLNVDATRLNAARTVAATDVLSRTQPGAAVPNAIGQWAGIAGSQLNVLSNLASGLTDTITGHLGDRQSLSELDQAVQKGNVGASILKGVTGFADGMLTAGSGTGMLAYTALTGTGALANAYTKAANDGEWDEVTGSFHRYQNIEQRLAAAGSSAIDVSQTLLPGLLRRGNALGAGGRDSVQLADLRNPGDKGRVTIMSRTFDAENINGTPTILRESKAQSLVGWLAPSTAIERLTTRAGALSEAMRTGKAGIEASDLYRAAARMEHAPLPWKLAMVNGFGEASEEVAQAYMNGAAVGWAPQPQDVVNAAIAGFTMGAGMSFGARIGTVTADERQRLRANSLAMLDGRDGYDRATWKAMDDASKYHLSTATRTIEKGIREQLRQFREDMTDLTVTSSVALSVKQDAVREMQQAKTKLQGDGYEFMARLMPFENVNIPSHHIMHSADTTELYLNARADALKQMIAAKHPDSARLQQIHDTLRGLIDNTVAPGLEIYRRTGDERTIPAINQVIQAYWEGTANGVDPYLSKRAVELLFSRSPNDNPGSFQMFMPQIDLQMTRDKEDGSSKITQAVEKLTSHDNDGDQLKLQARYVPDDASRRILRMGIHHWSASDGATAKPLLDAEGKPVVDAFGNTVQTKDVAANYGGSGYLNVTSRVYEDATLRNMGALAHSNEVGERQEVYDTFHSLVDDLQTALPGVREETFTSFFRTLTTLDPQSAKSEFYRALYKDSGKLFALSERGTLGDESIPRELWFPPETQIGLWIEDKIQQHLERWRDGRALRTENQFAPKPAAAEGYTVPGTPSDLRTTRPQEAATLGQTNNQRTGGSDDFRARGHLAYGPINSKSLDAEGHTNADQLLQQLTEWFTTLTRLRSGSAIENIRIGNSPVLQEARRDLENLVKASDPEAYAQNKQLAMLRAAQLPFWNFSESQISSDSWHMENHTKFNGTLGQTLLKNAAERVGHLTPPEPGELSVEALYGNVNPSRALQLILGDIAPENIMSAEEAAQIGQFSTLDSTIRHYTQLVTKADREAWRDHKKILKDSYADSNSAYRIFVDTVTEAVDKELAHGDPVTGKAVGRLADEDRKFHSDVVIKAFEALAKITRQLGLQGRSNQEIISSLESNSQAVETLLSMFTPEMRVRIIGAPKGGKLNEVVLPAWFYDILSEPNAEKAAMIYFNAIFTFERDARRDSVAPSNTWVALYESLDDVGRITFEDMRTTATSVQAFVDTVNRKLAFGRPPMLAWRTDTTMFDPASTRAGWQWAAPSAERRQAIRDANEYLVSRAETLSDDMKFRASNVAYANNLLRALNENTQSTTYQNALTSLRNRLSQGVAFHRAAMGPAGMRAFVQVAHRGLDYASASKGVASPGSAQFGDTDIKRDQTSFGSQFEQVFDSVTNMSASDLRFNPQSLTQPLRIETNSGAIINWNPSNERSFLELFLADDGAYQGMLFNLVNPIVYDETLSGRAAKQFLFPNDLKQIVGTQFYKGLLEGSEGNSEDETNELMISYFNAISPRNNGARLLTHVAIARTTGGANAELSPSDYSRLTRHVSKLIRSLAGVAERDLPGLQEAVRQTAITAYLQKNHPELKLETAAQRGNAMDQAVAARKADADKALAAYSAQPSEAGAVEYLHKTQLYTQALGMRESKTAGEMALSALTIPWGESSEQIVRSAIRDYISSNMASLATTLTGEDLEALIDYRNAPQSNVDSFRTFGDDATNKKYWNILAKAVALHTVVTSNGYRAASAIPTPQAKEMELFDPTFTYLVEQFVSRETWETAQRFKAAAPEANIPGKTPADFLADAADTILNPAYLGTWTPELVMQHMGMDRALDASGSSVQVSIGGLAPQNYIAADISSTRSWKHPSADLARPYSIPLEDLIDGFSDPYQDGLNGDPWIMLENASVVARRYDPKTNQWTGEGPVLVARNDQGEVVQTIILDAATSAIQNGGIPEAGSPTTIRSITHRSLVDVAARAAEQIRDESLKLSVEFKMFHPADKTPEFANSIHFDGTVGASDAARSLYSALLSGTNGLAQRLQRMALDSIKGSVAIFNQAHPRAFDEKDPARLAQLINEMSKTIMMTRIGEDYFLGENVYRAVYKMVRDRLLIQGTDAEGNTVTLTTEQYLTAPVELQDARVITLSRQALETLRGSTSGSGYARHLTRAPKIGGEGEAYSGVYSQEQLDRLPDLGSELKGVTDIGEGLRQSGVTNSERTSTFRYKTWSVDNQKVNFRPFAEYDAQVQKIQDARRDPSKIGLIRETNLRLMQSVGRTLESMGRVDDATRALLIGDLNGVPEIPAQRRMDSVRSLDQVLGLLNSYAGRIFQLDRRNTGTADEGNISDVRRIVGPDSAQLAAARDVVWFHLETFKGDHNGSEWKQAVRDQINAAKELGVTMIFTHPTEPQAVFNAEDMLRSGDSLYEQNSSRLPMYSPKDPTQLEKTVRAREASWIEGRVRSLDNLVLTALDPTGRVTTDAEGIWIDPRGDLSGLGRAVSSGIVPTNMFAHYNNPGTADFGARLATTLDFLLDPANDGITYLAQQQLLGNNEVATDARVAQLAAEIFPLVKKMRANLNTATGRPQVGTDFQPGDLIAVINPDGKLAFIRWGYDDAKNYEAQDANGLDGNAFQGLESTSSIRWVGQDRVPADQASVRGGDVVEWFEHPVFGLQAIFESDLTLANAKLINEQGKKSTGNLIPADKRPDTPMLRNMFPTTYDTWKSFSKKGATSNTTVNSRQAIMVFGMDFVRPLANALGFMDGHPNFGTAARWTIEQWTSADQDVRDAVTARVRNALELHRSSTTDRVANPQALADRVFAVSTVTDAAQTMIEESRGMSLAAIQKQARDTQTPQTETDAEIAYLSAVLEYLKGDGTYVSQVLGAAGMDQPKEREGRTTYEMPSALTEFIDVDKNLSAYVQGDMNDRMVSNVYDSDGNLVAGWTVKDDWSVLQQNYDGKKYNFILVASRTDPTGEDHSELSVNNMLTATDDNASNQQQQIAAGTLRLDLGYGVYNKNLNDALKASSHASLMDATTADPTLKVYGQNSDRLQDLTVDEQLHRRKASYKIKGSIQLLNRADWTEKDSVLREVNEGYNLIYNELGLVADGRYQVVVDSMIRTFYRAWSDPQNPDRDKLSARAVLEAQQAILKQLRSGRWPSIDGRMPAIDARIVDIIARNGTWMPDGLQAGANKRVAMLTHALSTIYYSSTKIPPNAKDELDGLMLTYEPFLTRGVWPASMYPEVVQALLDPKGDKFHSTIDPYSQMLMERGDKYRSFDTMAGDEDESITRATDSGTTSTGTRTELSRRSRADREAAKKQLGMKEQTPAQIAKNGYKLQGEVQATNAFWRYAQSLRTIMPQLNPLLWVWNPIDVQWRRMPGAAAGLLTGSSTGVIGRSIRDRVAYLAGRTEKYLAETDPAKRSALIMQAFSDAFGIESPYIDAEANAMIPSLIDDLLHDPHWRSEIASETRHRPDEALMSRGDMIRQGTVDRVSKMQDFTYGMFRKYEAQMYIEQVLEHERVNNPQVEALDVLLKLRTDHLYFMKQSTGAHDQAVRNIQNIKGAKQSTLGAMIDSILIPATQHHNAFVHGPANAIALLAKFRNFAISSAIQMTGAQGVDAAGAILLQTLAFKKRQMKNNDLTVPPTDYLSQVLESADIADLFIRSGLSHTGLFMAALAFQGLGLTGETDEDRKRKRINQLHGLGQLYDPRDIVNDFRNRDSIWLDNLAAGPLGFLSAQFATPNAEGKPQRSPANLHWTLNFFVAPVMGVAEFMQTGDFYDLYHGFESAFNNMPLINTNFFWDAYTTGQELYTAATDNVPEDPGSLTQGVSLLIKTVGVFEKALLENAFVNEVVAMTDEYNRAPFTKVQTDAQGNVVRDLDGQPYPTDEKDQQIDTNPNSPTYGQTVERRQTVGYEEGLLRAFTMNNQTAALIGNIVTGFQFGKGDSFFRKDMAPAQTTLAKAPVQNDEAEALILSFWDPQNQRETLTRGGAERLIDSLHAGTIKASDPAFKNIFLTKEQRDEIADDLKKKILVEGMTTLKLSEKAATQRLYDIWYGPANNPYVVPLSDVVYSQGQFADDKGIPYKETTTYRQLNTTWVKGPDGKMWATGIARNNVLGLTVGLDPFQQSALGGSDSNLNVDEILNSTDPTAQINTGYRSLTRVSDNSKIPDMQDLMAADKKNTQAIIDSIKDLNSDLYQNGARYASGYRYGRGGAYRSGGGGGYGGSNPFMPFLNGMRTPYADNIPQIYINNINPRRASIRRERFDSERGRLNQQQ